MTKQDEFAIENQASIETEENKNFLALAPQHSQKALAKVEAITKVIDGAVRLALQRTVAQDWVCMGGKYYLQATGVEKIRSVFGLYFRDRTIVREDLGDGVFAYICTGTAGSKLLDSLYGETTIEVEGMRASNDPFFVGRDGNKEPDAMDVRKAAFANFQVRAAKALLGFGNYSAEDLAKMGVRVSEVSKVDYQKGATGGGQTDKISEAQRKRLFAICKEARVSEVTMKEHLQKKYGISSSNDILRKDYDAIVKFAQDGGVETIQADRQVGEDG